MKISKHLLITLISVAFLCRTVGLVTPPTSQAEVATGGIQFKNILKAFFPPCGPGTRYLRFVTSKDGDVVCDNKTGLRWQQSPSSELFGDGHEAMDYCTNLDLNNRAWRLAKVEEYLTPADYGKSDQAAALNKPHGPFENVLSARYWTATYGSTEGGYGGAFVLILILFILLVIIGGGDGEEESQAYAWCASGDMNADVY